MINALNALKNFLYENIKLLLIGMVAILMIISTAIILSLYFGGDVTRRPIIAEISGSAYITRNNMKLRADKNSFLQSGDILTTDSNGTVRIAIDNDKYIFVEPNSYLYIYYTDIASKGDISVNLSRGAVICQLRNPLKRNATFVLKTPNGVVDVKGTVFRTEFNYYEKYGEYNNIEYHNVMITDVQNFDGTVNLQLYDSSQEPFDLPMVLMERTAARMITSDEVCRYAYVNYNIDLISLSEMTLREILRADNEGKLAFSLDEVNAAYVAAVNRNRFALTETAPTEIDLMETIPTTTEAAATTTTAATAPSEASDDENRTLGTTRARHVYTTYSGIKWWEITGNPNTNTDYDDWFNENENQPYENEQSETVTAGTSAEP